MVGKKRRVIGGALLAAGVLLAAGCGGASKKSSSGTSSGGSASSTSAPSSGGLGAGIKIAVVTHGQASDPFWSVVKNGVDQAARDTGASVSYNAPETFDMVKMSELIDTAVATKPDGLVVSVPDYDALHASIEKAVQAGIPVITINSGSDVYQKLGALTHIGQTELEAGLGGGEKMGAAGVKNALCINQEVGNAALDLRCKGFAEGLAKTGGTSKVIAVDLKNPTDSQQKISAAFASGGIDGVLTLGPTGATPALAALQAANKLDSIKLATFDLSPDVLTALKDGKMLFAIDQQQFLQGYLPVQFLVLYKKYGLLPGGGGVVLTGPGFVTKENAAQVIDLSKQGIR